MYRGISLRSWPQLVKTWVPFWVTLEAYQQRADSSSKVRPELVTPDSDSKWICNHLWHLNLWWWNRVEAIYSSSPAESNVTGRLASSPHESRIKWWEEMAIRAVKAEPVTQVCSTHYAQHLRFNSEQRTSKKEAIQTEHRWENAWQEDAVRLNKRTRTSHTELRYSQSWRKWKLPSY